MGLVGKVALLESEPPENWSQKTDLSADLQETWRIQGLLQFSSSTDTRRRWCGWGASFVLFDSDTIDRFWSNIGCLEFNPCGAKEQDKRPDHAERRALSHAQRFPGSQWYLYLDQTNGPNSSQRCSVPERSRLQCGQWEFGCISNDLECL